MELKEVSRVKRILNSVIERLSISSRNGIITPDKYDLAERMFASDLDVDYLNDREADMLYDAIERNNSRR